MDKPTKAIPRLIELVRASKPNLVPHGYQRKTMEELSIPRKWVSIANPRPKNLGYIGGDKAYMMLGSLAKLEMALMRWTMEQLIEKYNFTPVITPNILHSHIIESCGFPTNSERTQVYKISGNDTDSIIDEVEGRSSNSLTNRPCIAGTSEFALVSIHIGDTIPADELPKRYCAMSTCYRAESSSSALESGLYRVHYFKKVEMVALTMPEDSDKLHHEFLNIEKEMFSKLGFDFKILDMPKDDLGLSAAKKYDIEAWMPARQLYGEISSTSNCTDYQSSRLNIKYKKFSPTQDGKLMTDENYVHTVNGTACSSVRTIITLLEQNQTEDGHIIIPDCLKKYLNGSDRLPIDGEFDILMNLDLYPEP